MRRLLICLLFAFFAPLSLQAQTTGPATSVAPTTTAVRDPVTNNWKLVTVEKSPGAPTAALAGAGAGNIENGTHQYRVTFVTAVGQTNSGAVSSTVTVVDKTANGKVSLSSIPTGSAFVTSRKIYRTAAGGGAFKLLTTLADNTTTTYTDNTADASLTTTAPTANTTANSVILYTGSTGVVTIPGYSGGVPTTITVANEAADTTTFPIFCLSATGDCAPKTNSSVTFNSNTGALGVALLNVTGTGGISYIDGTEGIAATGIASHDILYADSAAHRWKTKDNNGSADTLAKFSDGLNVFAAGAIANGSTATTQSQADASTKLATTAYVDTGLGGKQATITFGTGVQTALGVNIGSAGAPVLFNGALGTPSSGTLTSATGLPISTGLTGAGTGVLTALAVNVGSAGAFVTFNGAGGTPSSLTLTNGTGLPTTGLTGTLQAAQEPAHTGDVTNSAGSLALAIAANAVTLAKLATQATNTVLGNATSGTAVPTALAVGTCSTAGSALIWTTNTGFGCNTSITAAAVPASGLTGATLAAGVTASSLTSLGTITSLTATTINAFTLGGTIAGGGNQLNNIIIGTTTPLAGSFTSLGYSTTLTGTSANASALAVGRLGATTPALQVDASTATSITGIKIKSAATGGGVAISAIGEASNGNLTLDAQGSGTITIGGTSTGAITLTRATTLSAALINTGIPADTAHTDTSVCQDTTTHQFYSGTGTLGVCLGTSSARFKPYRADLPVGLSQVMALKPIQYRLDAQHGDPSKLLYGFTAEQGGTVLPALMGRDLSGLPNTFDYLGIVPVLVKAIQEQQAEIEALKARP